MNTLHTSATNSLAGQAAAAAWRRRDDAVVTVYGSPEYHAFLGALADGAFERERDGTAPSAPYDLVRRFGIGATRVPAALGGGGATLTELVASIIDFAAVDPNVGHTLRSHYCFVEAHMPDFLRGRLGGWLAEVLRGALVGNATTELGTRNTGGTEGERFATKLRPAEDGSGGYVLDGTKYYSTGSIFSDWINVVASVPGAGTATALVPVGRQGVTLEDDWDGIGQRLTGSGTSRFDGVHVNAEEVFLHEDGGHATGYVSTLAQLHLTAVIAGILRAASRDAVEVLRGRARTFSHGSSERATDDPLLQHVVGQLATNAFVAESVVMSAARSLEAAAAGVLADGTPDADLLEQAAVDAAHAKIAVDGLAERSGWELFDVAGASATLASRNLDRHWRNARTIASHNPSIYKTRALGDRLVNDSPLPPSALF
jgi:alkylation response protein AidB-like acyl-CoA dehydrogenase